jgi:uncharacterized membrane protein YqjE
MEDTAKNAAGGLGEYTYPGRTESDRSAADLVRDIISNVQGMVRSEVKLAKAELREETQKTVAGAKNMGAAVVAALFALSFVLWTVAMLLMRVMPDWAATLTVGVLLGITASVLYKKAGELRVPTPDKTIENIKENVSWMKNQTRS